MVKTTPKTSSSPSLTGNLPKDIEKTKRGQDKPQDIKNMKKTIKAAIKAACPGGRLTKAALLLYANWKGWPSPEEIMAEGSEDYELYFYAQEGTDYTNSAKLYYPCNPQIREVLDDFQSDLLNELGWCGMTCLRCPRPK